MAFKNEYVPPLENENSEFFRRAREILHTGHSQYDRWTVDREREMVLFRRGGGHSIEDAGEEYWSFISKENEYHIDTSLISREVISPSEISEIRSFSVRESACLDDSTISLIKASIGTYAKWYLFDPEAYKKVNLTLVDEKTGEEV